MILSQHAKQADRSYWEGWWDGQDIGEKISHFENNELFPFLLQHLNPKSSVLEGGCGLGQVVISLAEQGHDIIGVDFETKALDRAIKFRPDLKKRFIAMDLEHLKFKDGSFDGYISLGVIEHKRDHSRAILRESRRVLKPGGKLFMLVPYINPLRMAFAPYIMLKNLYLRKKGNPFYQYYYSRRAIERILQQEGFRPLEYITYGGDGPLGFPHMIMVAAERR